MVGVGPEIPAHLLSKQSTTPPEDDKEAGPSLPVGPIIPPAVLRSAPARPPIAVVEDEDDEDDYAPALPPDLAASRTSHNQPGGSSKRVQGPTLPSTIQRRPNPSYDDDDDDYGPMPLPAGVSVEEKSGVREFLEKEETRRKLVEEAAKPKALQRQEWMLVPPSSSDFFDIAIDPTKLTKPRQFSRSTAPSRNVDSSLWTETPAERQQRVADEVAGKRRRAANADPDAGDENAELEARKRRRRDEEIRQGVDDYTKKNRGGSLLEQRAKGEKEAKEKSGEAEGPPGIWDHGRDMALSGRLMDDGTRDKYIREAKGLGDRFGTGKSGGFL